MRVWTLRGNELAVELAACEEPAAESVAAATEVVERELIGGLQGCQSGESCERFLRLVCFGDDTHDLFWALGGGWGGCMGGSGGEDGTQRKGRGVGGIGQVSVSRGLVIACPTVGISLSVAGSCTSSCGPPGPRARGGAGGGGE